MGRMGRHNVPGKRDYCQNVESAPSCPDLATVHDAHGLCQAGTMMVQEGNMS